VAEIQTNDVAANPAVLATTVLLVRDRGGLEVLMVVRHAKAHFASALVFPGGLVDPEDHDAVWDGLSVADAALSRKERAIRLAGFRELYEETGILLVDRPEDGAPPPVAAAATPFMEMVSKQGSRLDLDAMHPFAHWVTPEFAPKRFDTHFRICGLETEVAAVSDGFETVSVEWLRPKDAIDLGASGQRNVLFPTRLNLQMLAEAGSVEEAIAQAKARTIVTVTPRMEQRESGRVLTIPLEAGYGVQEEPVGGMP
jgi:8-oxo-dGTP pyrophosphatase MutT (NUDIX family)